MLGVGALLLCSGSYFGTPQAVAFKLRRTIPTFDLNANLQESRSFYNLPYPSDLRLDSEGRPNLAGFPIRESSKIVQRLRDTASDRPGFPTTAAAYFRFNQPLAHQKANQLIPTNVDAPIFLVDIDPNSPERGRLFPIVASTPLPDIYYVPAFLLTVAPFPGIVLRPGRQYAYVVRRTLRDVIGRKLRVPSTFKTLRRGETPEGPLGPAARELYQPLWATLDQIGVDPKSVAVATVFTTGDVVAETARLSQQVLNRYDLMIENLTLDAQDGATHPRFCELKGTIRMPQFQSGKPPFITKGLFEFDANQTLIEQRSQDTPLVITLPKTPMPPDGYPLVAYYHGSNGLSTQVVDRGPITEPDGAPTPGLGPAHVLAAQGFATVGSALPLNPQRILLPVPDAYLNPLNLAAYRDTFRQGVIEQRLLLESIERLQISPPILAGCAGPSLPSGKTHFRIQTQSVMALGQSHGAQYATMMAAVDPKIRAVAPTGSGGFWALLISENKLSRVLGVLLGTIQRLDHLYPALRLLQTAWEPVEPMVYMPRISKRPLANAPVRSIYQPVGQGDSEFPESVFNAMALASGVQQAGPVLWSQMQESLALDGLDGIAPYPVIQNLTSEGGTSYTGAVVQYEGDGIADPHTIFSQLDDVKFQYSCFFKSAQATGMAVVPAPQPLGTSCPKSP